MKKFTCVVTSTAPDKYKNVLTREALLQFINTPRTIIYVDFRFDKPPVGKVDKLYVQDNKLIAEGKLMDEYAKHADNFYLAPSFRIVTEEEKDGASVISCLDPMDFGIVLQHADACATPIQLIEEEDEVQ